MNRAVGAGNLERLEAGLRACGSSLLAYSGGVDSTFLMAVAGKVLGDRFLAVTVRSLFHDAEEVDDAVRRAKQGGVRHEVLEMDLAGEGEILKNPPERCYLCKRAIFSRLTKMAVEKGLGTVIDATHCDDLLEYRPGLKALEELGVASPLRDAGYTKEDVRRQSAEMGLDGYDRPSNPCLATRIPFESTITAERLGRVASGEKVLRLLGFRSPRVRDYGTLARIELNPEELERASQPSIREAISKPLRELGYTYVTLDLTGYRTGSLEEELEGPPAGSGKTDL